ncbi:hypothetical protein RRG08_049098 [Elysia crispata]|uniref:Laminin EGF-like domain-containing protein n=1 Tax=Elysia crispata TaxID=231223 RepID=A0AAE1EBX4_9GAST|nr:hypothetical protein RRG08_049098 [Elysia crispata]
MNNSIILLRQDLPDQVDCGKGCNDRLVGFTLTAQSDPSTATPHSYTDPGEPVQDSYTVVPSPRISFPVKRVKFVTGSSDKILTLCEVFIFGDTECPADHYGLRCERQCNCANNESCFVHSGRCPSGCATGYTGEDCSECEPGVYGAGCSELCSVNCAGSNNACNNVTGTCDVGYHACDRYTGDCQSCPAGFMGAKCDQKCDSGFYGAGCNATCSDHCHGRQNLCDHVNGTCDLGCDPGYLDSLCAKKCPSGSYGKECTKTCSDHCAGDQNSCHHVNGTCDLGCDPGYQGSSCTQACPRGEYGPGCNQTCSTQCKGRDNPCDHVDGSCYLGCVQDDQSPICRNAVPQREEQDGSGLNSTGFDLMIVAVVAVVVAAVVIGMVCWRLHRVSAKLSLASARNEVREEAEVGSNPDGNVKRFAQQGVDANVRPNHYYEPVGAGPQTGDAREIQKTSVQQDRAGIRRSNQHYDHTEMTGPENDHMHDTDLDHYDSPLDLMRVSGAYEIPDPKPVNSESQDIDVPASTNTLRLKHLVDMKR